MNNERFNEVLEARIAGIKDILANKNKEYSSDTDRLHNFRVAANIGPKPITAPQALLGMWRKHLVSIIDIIEDTAKGVYPSKKIRDEKITDAVNYLILLEALLIDDGPPDEPEPIIATGTCGSLYYKNPGVL
jgi:hypothetical protein